MGVDRATDEIDGSQTDLYHRRSQSCYATATFPPIVSQARSLFESITAIRDANPGRDIAVAVDVGGFLGRHFIAIPGRLHREALKQRNSAYRSEKLAAADATFGKALAAEIAALARSLDAFLTRPGDRIVFFFDNKKTVGKAKAEEWLERYDKKRIDRAHYYRSKDELMKPKCRFRSRDAHLDTISATAYSVAKLPDYAFDGSAWSGVPGSRTLVEAALGVPADAGRGDVLAAYAAANADIFASAGAKIRFVQGLDEADCSMYRFCATVAPSAVTLAITQDSDLNFIARAADTNYTLRFVGSIKRAKVTPWRTVNNRSLQAFRHRWCWESDTAALVAVLLNGHDYVPRGVLGMGFVQLRKLGIVRNTLEETKAALVAYNAERHANAQNQTVAKAIVSMTDKWDQLVLGLKVCSSYHHEHLVAPATLVEQLPPLDEANLPPRSSCKRRRGIQMRFPAVRPAGARLPETSDVQPAGKKLLRATAQAASRKPARVRDTQLHGGRGAHRALSTLHHTRRERHRHRVILPPHLEPLVSPDIDVLPQDRPREKLLARQELLRDVPTPAGRAKALAALDKVESATAAATASAPANAQPDVIETIASASLSLEEEEAAKGRGRGKLVPGKVYAMRTMKVSLLANLLAYCRAEVGQARYVEKMDESLRNPLFGLIRLVVVSTRLINVVLNEALRQYVAELTTNPLLVDVCRYRFGGGALQWGNIVDAFYRMLCLPNQQPEENTSDETLAEYMADWVDGLNADQPSNKPATQSRLARYMEDGEVSDRVNHAFSRKKPPPALNTDPAMFLVAGRMLRNSGGRTLLPTLTNAQRWTSQMRNVGVALARKLTFAELFKWLRKRVSQACREAGDVSKTSVITDALLDVTLVDVQHPGWVAHMLGHFEQAAGPDSSIGIFLARFKDSFGTLPGPGTLRDALYQQKHGHLVPFFSALGRDFRVNILPRHVAFDYTLVYSLLNQSLNTQGTIADGLLEWISYSWVVPADAINDRFQLKAVDVEALRMLTQGKDAFKRLMDGTYIARSHWKARVAAISREILGRLGEPKQEATEFRIPLMCMLFSDGQVPKGHVMAGTWTTDGTALCFQTLDITKIKLPAKGAGKDKAGKNQAPNLRDLYDLKKSPVDGTVTVAAAFEAVMEWQPKFCSSAVAKLWLGRAWRSQPQPDVRGKKKDKPKRQHNVVENVWQRITGEKSTPVAPKHYVPFTKPPAGIKGRRQRIGARIVQVVADFDRVATRNGLPVWLKRLDGKSRTAFLEEVRALFVLHGRPEAKEWPEDKLLQEAKTVGVDPGQAFPLAMALNDLLGNRSDALTLSPWALETSRRTSNRAQSDLQRSSKVEWEKLWQLKRDTAATNPDAPVLRTVELFDILHRIGLQGSREYGSHLFHEYRQRKRFENWLVQQVIRWIWPEATKDCPPSRVVLMFIGDECGLGNDRRMMTADFAKPLLRAILEKMRRDGLPIIFRLVDEAYTSQCCPDPSCLRPATQNWRAVPGALDPVTAQNCAGKEDWVRSRLFKPTWLDTADIMYRVLQCEKCHKCFNRDTSGAFCIAQAGEHVMIHGSLPWSA